MKPRGSGPKPLEKRANGGACYRCGDPRPPGRTRYCSDRCTQLAYAERQDARQVRRMAQCASCGGPKDRRVRGARFCSTCHERHEDVVDQVKREYNRRYYVKTLEARAAAGERIGRRHVDIPEGRKWCPRCQDHKPEAAFPKRKENGKPAAYCSSCQRAYNRERRVKLAFGLSWDEYELLLNCQENRCAICGGLPRKLALAVDHDHKTGEIRGLLCGRCNHKLLGAARENPAILRRAADYLESHEARDVFGEPKYVPGFRKGDKP